MNVYMYIYVYTIAYMYIECSLHCLPRPEYASIGCNCVGHQVERGLLLNVVVGECAAVFQLLACEDEPLLVWRNACGNKFHESITQFCQHGFGAESHDFFDWLQLQ